MLMFSPNLSQSSDEREAPGEAGGGGLVQGPEVLPPPGPGQGVHGACGGLVLAQGTQGEAPEGGPNTWLT
jgi:hypothetical protein